MLILLSQVAYAWLQGVGVGLTPIIGTYHQLHEPDHGEMTVLRSREDRGIDVTPMLDSTVSVESFPDRLTCVDALDGHELTELAYQRLWQV